MINENDLACLSAESASKSWWENIKSLTSVAVSTVTMLNQEFNCEETWITLRVTSVKGTVNYNANMVMFWLTFKKNLNISFLSNHK